MTFCKAVYWGEQIEGLKHQAKVKALFPLFFFLLLLGDCASRDAASFNPDFVSVRRFQKVKAPQQSGFAAARTADNNQGLSFVQREIDSLNTWVSPKFFIYAFYF